jgi:hypothetical protein
MESQRHEAISNNVTYCDNNKIRNSKAPENFELLYNSEYICFVGKEIDISLCSVIFAMLLCSAHRESTNGTGDTIYSHTAEAL